MPEYVEGIYIPKSGDRINYYESTREVHTNVLVTQTMNMGGYTNVWLDGMSEDDDPLFNINHSTGHTNTEYSRRGKWMLVSKRSDLVVPRTFKVPVIPDDINRIATIGSNVHFTRVPDSSLWLHVTLGGFWTVSDLLAVYSDGFEEVLESPYEAAVRRLRASKFKNESDTILTYQQVQDIRTVAAHVVEDSNV